MTRKIWSITCDRNVVAPVFFRKQYAFEDYPLRTDSCKRSHLGTKSKFTVKLTHSGHIYHAHTHLT
ncbi:MAG: hypothetical protein K0S42_1486 [Microvirga sp.]|nr:hypothetical protein [Microvirga sp.]